MSSVLTVAATEVRTLFHMQAPHFRYQPMRITALTGARTAVVEDKAGTQYHAWFCTSSHEYWQARVHLQQRDADPCKIDLVVCQEHTTCLPIGVIPLAEEGRMIKAFELPRSFSFEGFQSRKRHTSLEMYTFLGMLACGRQEAYDLLADSERMHPSSQCRYRQRLKALTRRKRGNQTMRHQQGA